MHVSIPVTNGTNSDLFSGWDQNSQGVAVDTCWLFIFQVLMNIFTQVLNIIRT